MAFSMDKCFVILVTIFLWFTSCSRAGNLTDIKITPLKNNPGIFYEYIGNVRLARTYWHVVVSLDCKNLMETANWDVSHLLDIQTSCLKTLSPSACKTLIPSDAFKTYTNTLNSLQKDLTEIFTDVDSTEFSDVTLPKTLIKRGAPIELFGWASKKLFGVMDAEDRDDLNNQLSELYNKQINTTLLAAEQTHLIRSNLEEVHQIINNNRANIRKMYEALKINLNHNIFNDSINEQHIINWVIEYEQTLARTVNSYKTLLTAIQVTRQGRLHPLMLTHKQTQSLLWDINNHTDSAPVNPDKREITPEYLFTVSKTSLAIVKGRVVIKISFPISDNKDLQAYKIHSLPIPTLVPPNRRGFLKIKANFRYIIVSKDLKSYMLLQEDFFERCTNYHKIFLCNPDAEFYTDAEPTPCEFSLLTNPTSETIKACSMDLVLDTRPKWLKLKTTDEWLFSTGFPLNINLVCGSKQNSIHNINNTGILTINGKCVAHLKSTTLFGVNNIKISKTFNYQPKFSFDAERNEKFSLIESAHPEDQTEILNWATSQEAVSLKELEDKFKEASVKRKNIIATYRNLAGSTIINVLIAIFLYLALINFCPNLRLRPKAGNKDRLRNRNKNVIITTALTDDRLNQEPPRLISASTPFLNRRSLGAPPPPPHLITGWTQNIPNKSNSETCIVEIQDFQPRIPALREQNVDIY